jgi:hypothetical protein
VSGAPNAYAKLRISGASASRGCLAVPFWRGALRVKNDVRTQLQAAIAAGTIRHSNKPLGVTYNAALGYTTIRLSLMGARLEIH